MKIEVKPIIRESFFGFLIAYLLLLYIDDTFRLVSFYINLNYLLILILLLGVIIVIWKI